MTGPTLLQGRQYTPAVATDIRATFARFCPVWAQRMASPQMPLPIAAVTHHHKPRSL